MTCCAVLAVLVLVRPPTPGWPPPRWVFAACDVGQGDALVLNAGSGAAVVVDAGPDPAAVDGCLRRLGVQQVPLVIAHPLPCRPRQRPAGGAARSRRRRRGGHVRPVPGTREWPGRQVAVEAGVPCPRRRTSPCAMSARSGSRWSAPDPGAADSAEEQRAQQRQPGALAEVRGVRLLLHR
ncbi:MAG: hypothetical protein R2734_15675 [Nocardioides sp.]